MISHIFTICCSSIRKLLLRDTTLLVEVETESGDSAPGPSAALIKNSLAQECKSESELEQHSTPALSETITRRLRSQSPHFPVCATQSLHASSLMWITLRTRKSSLLRQGEARFECMQACLTHPSTVPAASAATADKASPAASNVQSYNILQQVAFELEHLCFGRHCPTQTPSQKPSLQHVPNPHYFQISSHAQLHD